MSKKKFHEYLYEVENLVDEFAIAFLSFGAIAVLINAIFFAPGDINFMSLGQLLYPWIVMLGLMIIGRELWLLNRNIQEYVEGE